MEFNPSGYRGDPGIPHSDTKTFGYLLACSNIALFLNLQPGRFPVLTDTRPSHGGTGGRTSSLVNIVQHQGARRDTLRGKPPRYFLGQARKTNRSWEEMWWDHLHYKRWMLERNGCNYRAVERI
ncbi:hypothetical protein HKI87_12g69020 [Chloropicon roscoffensis]|uniref:Uncharacterized protein n=1 Tax=Chloropicon roscoffensis TaxID=1461544 RepID=A0A7S3FLY4_9CHLO|mmetsp:Transcript_10768/g.32889  ORF Transcript_10768/g.32889 Transcript_10768/m.32889 type:complete len:124 (+) Transcript_10768:124-495(+)